MFSESAPSRSVTALEKQPRASPLRSLRRSLVGRGLLPSTTRGRASVQAIDRVASRECQQRRRAPRGEQSSSVASDQLGRRANPAADSPAEDRRGVSRPRSISRTPRGEPDYQDHPLIESDSPRLRQDTSQRVSQPPPRWRALPRRSVRRSTEIDPRSLALGPAYRPGTDRQLLPRPRRRGDGSHSGPGRLSVREHALESIRATAMVREAGPRR
jgi:hypothetical protein